MYTNRRQQIIEIVRNVLIDYIHPVDLVPIAIGLRMDLHLLKYSIQRYSDIANAIISLNPKKAIEYCVDNLHTECISEKFLMDIIVQCIHGLIANFTTRAHVFYLLP